MRHRWHASGELQNFSAKEGREETSDDDELREETGSDEYPAGE